MHPMSQALSPATHARQPQSISYHRLSRKNPTSQALPPKPPSHTTHASTFLCKAWQMGFLDSQVTLTWTATGPSVFFFSSGSDLQQNAEATMIFFFPCHGTATAIATVLLTMSSLDPLQLVDSLQERNLPNFSSCLFFAANLRVRPSILRQFSATQQAIRKSDDHPHSPGPVPL
ncbi:hypothetical protein MRB53_030212 [Persea americana]|uniref:Uncharacterized protein n=1 Tax=Persea americana TaxID=3435 RepID=A0ACC2KKN5_PERAE|nr:hypothetical protein MRB53_030212 [Persea americana]